MFTVENAIGQTFRSAGIKAGIRDALAITWSFTNCTSSLFQRRKRRGNDPLLQNVKQNYAFILETF